MIVKKNAGSEKWVSHEKKANTVAGFRTGFKILGEMESLDSDGGGKFRVWWNLKKILYYQLLEPGQIIITCMSIYLI